MKRTRCWRWLCALGRAVLSVSTPSSVLVCLPPASAFEQWPADACLWTPGEEETDRRAVAEIDALLREISSHPDWRHAG